jgi:predicted enzyme related to lactoylglutathione lyase
MLRRVHSVVFFVPDPPEAARWYARVLGPEARRSERGLPTVYLDAVELGFHPADAKGPSGVAGSVAYFEVDDLDAATELFRSAGASLYRGPIVIEDGRRKCQMTDPFGNAVGFIGR